EKGAIDGVPSGTAPGREAEEPGKAGAATAQEGFVLGDQQVLQHRHAGEEADVLEGPGDSGTGGDTVAGEAMPGVVCAVRKGEKDAAGGRAVETGEAVEQRGFSR